MKEIKITKGFVVKVDDSDYDVLKKYKWHVSKNGNHWYAKTSIKKLNLYMHRVLLSLDSPNIFCDHKDHDTLNNQRSNLRACTRAENQRNKIKKIRGTSQYKGVTKYRNGWLSQLSYQNKTERIGFFKNELEAAIAYNLRASELFGEFALINQLQ